MKEDLLQHLAEAEDMLEQQADYHEQESDEYKRIMLMRDAIHFAINELQKIEDVDLRFKVKK